MIWSFRFIIVDTWAFESGSALVIYIWEGGKAGLAASSWEDTPSFFHMSGVRSLRGFDLYAANVLLGILIYTFTKTKLISIRRSVTFFIAATRGIVGY